jgi:hypothetical protein
MTFHDEIQQRVAHYVRSTEPPVTGTSGEVIRRGKRLRLRRRAIAGVAGVASVAVVGVLSLSLLERTAPAGDSTQNLGPAHQAPRIAHQAQQLSPDDTATLIESRVRADLPAGSTLVTSDIYGSDWNRNTPLPAEEMQNATSWIALFTVPPSGVLLTVDVGFRPVQDNGPDGAGCSIVPDCFYETQPDGSVLLGQQYTLADSPVRFVGRFDPLGRVTTIYVRSTGDDAGTPQFPYSVDELKALVNDPQLVIPEPQTWPPYNGDF